MTNNRLLFVFELGEMPQEWLTPSLVSSIKQIKADWIIHYFHSPVKQYRPGGLHPIRLFSLIWMHFFLPFKIILFRPKWIIVRTSPPLIQQAAQFWGSLIGAKTICWLMDYHPLIECELLKNKFGFKAISRFLDEFDRFFLNKFNLIICADSAMESLCNKRAPNGNIMRFPTWSNEPKYQPQNNFRTDRLNLIYAGNLGKGHDLSTFERLLNGISSKKQCIMHYLGTDTSAIHAFSEICKRTGTLFQSHNFQDSLHSFYKSNRIHYGLILMKGSMNGLISPSKYTGYIFNGIPIIYIGPEKTNSAEICSKFRAGIRISPSTPDNDIDKYSEEIINPENHASYCKNLTKAIEHYTSHESSTLAKILCEYIETSH